MLIAIKQKRNGTTSIAIYMRRVSRITKYTKMDPKISFFLVLRENYSHQADIKKYEKILNFDLEISDRSSDFVKDVDNVLKTALEVELPAERARCHNATDLTTDADEIANRQVASQSANQTEIDVFRERGIKNKF